jgi:hypothetical protein
MMIMMMTTMMIIIITIIIIIYYKFEATIGYYLESYNVKFSLSTP